MRLFLVGVAVVLAGCAHKSEIYSGGYNERPRPRKIEVSIIRCAGEMDFSPLLKSVPIGVIRYPPEMQRVGLTGTVTAKLTVDADGTAHDVEVEEASLPEFASAVADGLSRCQFLPARSRGTPVLSTIWCRVDFLNEED